MISSERVTNRYIQLNNCGIEQLWDRNYSCTRELGRKDFHILYITQGCGYAELDGKDYTLTEGDMLLYLPDEKQKYSFKMADKAVSCYLHFTGTGCIELLKKCGFLPDHIIHPGKHMLLEDIFKKLCDEKIFKKQLYEEMMDFYLMRFFAELSRIMYDRKRFSKNYDVIEKVCKTMAQEYKEPGDISRYADMCFLSVSRFHYVFKRHTGLTPVEYINSIKISHVKELLSHTDLSMSEIAESTGFYDQNYISRVFKKHTGVSPRTFSTTL